MKKRITFIFSLIIVAFTNAQNFELPNVDSENFEKVHAKIGGDFALQFQAIDHKAKDPVELIKLSKTINMPTANFKIVTDLAPGIQLYMNTYLSSRHHNEAWVEGGYLTMDKLPFLPASDGIMEYLTVRAGVMMPNYGDGHFFRSTNAAVKNNPFVGNWIMDAYTTNPGLDITFRNNGIIAVVGANNGRLDYAKGNDFVDDLVFNWKAGYDSQINDDLRLRATVSGYHVPRGHSGSTIWDGDRTGARYYYVMQVHDAVNPANDATDANFRSGRWGAGGGQSEMNSFMGNVFVQFHRLEVFGLFETMKGVRAGVNQNFTQIAGQALYRILDFYLGTRYNIVDNNNGSTVTRLNVGGGWNMLESVVVKLDYVNQKYNGTAHGAIDGGQFSGVVMEAAISF